MTESDRAKEWIRFAENDLKSAKVLLKEAIFNQVCFHAQQCVEKLLKAFLVLREIQPPRTHRLVDLLELALAENSEMEILRDRCLILDQYYLPSRYPDAIIGSKPTGLPSHDDAAEALSIAESIWLEISKYL